MRQKKKIVLKIGWEDFRCLFCTLLLIRLADSGFQDVMKFGFKSMTFDELIYTHIKSQKCVCNGLLSFSTMAIAKRCITKPLL
jgi:hypothetical protein